MASIGDLQAKYNKSNFEGLLKHIHAHKIHGIVVQEITFYFVMKKKFSKYSRDGKHTNFGSKSGSLSEKRLFAITFVAPKEDKIDWRVGNYCVLVTGLPDEIVNPNAKVNALLRESQNR